MSWPVEYFLLLSDKTAIVDDFGKFSYAELYTQISQYKAELDKQFGQSQVVVILSDYNFYSVSFFFALYQKQAIIVPIVSSNEEEVDKRLKVIKPDTVIKLNGPEYELTNFKELYKKHLMIQTLCDQRQSGLVLFSSGSTGEPKAMIHNLENLVNSYQGKKQKKLNMLVFLMFDHIGLWGQKLYSLLVEILNILRT